MVWLNGWMKEIEDSTHPQGFAPDTISQDCGIFTEFFLSLLLSRQPPLRVSSCHVIKANRNDADMFLDMDGISWQGS